MPFWSQVMRLIDHSQASVRAKCLVTLQLLFRTTATVSLLAACERKLMPTIERLVREKDPYLSSCLSSLLACVADLVPAIAHSISDGLASIAAQRKPIQPGGEFLTKKTLVGAKIPLHCARGETAGVGGMPGPAESRRGCSLRLCRVRSSN